MYMTDESRKTYQAIILLNELVNGGHAFTIVDNGDDHMLEPLFVSLLAKGYVQTSGNKYMVTAKGQDVYDTFMKRYTEYLKLYDIFSYVDLEKGEFAFEKFFDFDTDAQWDSYKNDSRFDDLRIAVALFKKIDPAEIVFMSFINENRFDTTANGWQMDLLDDDIWNSIEKICSTAIKPEEVGQDAMEDMITQGTGIMIKLLDEEAKRKAEQNNSNNANNQSYTEETVVEETPAYYRPYYDPFYVSPIWLLPLFLW